MTKRKKYYRNKNGTKVYPIDRDTWKLLHYDSMYFVPYNPTVTEKKLFVTTTDKEVKNSEKQDKTT